MKVWHVLANDCEAVVVDETPEAAAAQLGRPDAQVWEQKPTCEAFGIPMIVLPGTHVPFVIAGVSQPLMLWWRSLEA